MKGTGESHVRLVDDRHDRVERYRFESTAAVGLESQKSVHAVLVRRDTHAPPGA